MDDGAYAEGEPKTPIFNIDLKAFDTFILAIRSTDGKIIMRLDSDGTLRTTGDFVYHDNLGYYDDQKNEINYPESKETNNLPEKPNE